MSSPLWIYRSIQNSPGWTNYNWLQTFENHYWSAGVLQLLGLLGCLGYWVTWVEGTDIGMMEYWNSCGYRFLHTYNCRYTSASRASRREWAGACLLAHRKWSGILLRRFQKGYPRSSSSREASVFEQREYLFHYLPELFGRQVIQTSAPSANGSI